MIFTSPFWLIAILLALVPWLGPLRGKNRVQNIIRSIVFALLAIALAGPHWSVTASQIKRVLIVDRSESVAKDSSDSMLEKLRQFDKASEYHLVTTGNRPDGEVGNRFLSATHLDSSDRLSSSPLSSAIAVAQNIIPVGSGGSVTIASDSMATDDNDNRAVAAIRAADVPVHWIQLPGEDRSATPVAVNWSDPLRKGTTSALSVTITAARSDGRVVLVSDEKVLATAPLTESDQVQSVTLEFEPAEAGFLDGEIVVSVNGVSESLAVTLPIHDAIKLLYFTDLQTDGAEKLSDMIGPGFEVIDADPSDAAFADRLAEADLAMLDDLKSESLPESVEKQIVHAVTSDGLGLVMSGGRAAFGAGGWHERPLESLLPVEFVQKEEKRDPSTSLVIVIDTSGSMSGVRVQLAKEVARLAMRRLLPHDKVGIVEFYGAKRWAAPLQPASNSIELQRALNRMDAGGGTVILPALEEAFYGLQNVDTRYKHVLVLTDGGVEAGDFESLMRRMSSEGINVSTVLAGGGYHSEFLVNIANWGKGRFYNVPNRFNLPEILLKQPSTTKLPSYRPGEHPVQARGGSGWWGDSDVTKLDSLAGYVESKTRPGSEVLLETVREKHPVLATWRFGLGRVTAMTTEPVGEGTSSWQAWPDYGQTLAKILTRCAGDSRDPFRYEARPDGKNVIVHAIRQQPRESGSSGPINSGPAAWRAQPETNQQGEAVAFVRRSPDRFTAKLIAPPTGKQLRLMTSSTTAPQRSVPLVVASTSVSEQHVNPENCLSLGELAAVTGGETMSVESDWFAADTSTPTGQTLFSLAPWLYLLSLVLFLAEIIWRRLPSLTSVPASKFATAAILLVATMAADSVSAQSDNAKPVVSAELKTVVTELIQQAPGEVLSQDRIHTVFRQAILERGSVEGLLEWLAEPPVELKPAEKQTAAELQAHVAARRGDLQRAANVLTELLKDKKLAQRRSDLLVWQAKLFDALGEIVKAKKVYQSLTERDLSDDDQQFVRLRLALMGLLGDRDSKAKADAKSLIELAKQSDDISFRNRAANVLAVQDQHAKAIELFTIEGKGTQRFRNASRVTEWAIRAKKRDKAIETAWEAVDSSQLKRDRNYALTLLVESYRLKEKKDGLKALVEEFQKRNDAGEAMPAEMRTVWIGLLRELERTDDAIKLFKDSADDVDGFTIEMRRELLEMEGEAGQEDRMLQSYRDLIAAEPNELTWRAGLTQILLEKGKDAEARALWTDFVVKQDRASILMNSAQTLGEFGMDDIAESTIERMVMLRKDHGQALLYWADLQKRRGEVDSAEATLNRILEFDDIGDDVRAELASSYERIGRQDKAIEVIEDIRSRLKVIAEDMEMRLAWLYSEIGEEEKAMDQWLALWQKITSIPRRRYVEDRLMTVASRLGTLADIAIDLEEKLSDGTANDREAGLLVRIYSRVNDSVAATEISEIYMSKSGKNEVQQLQEKGRIYQICNDYWNYEKVIERLIQVDPKGETEYLRQLALSMLERGKSQQARKVLMTLRDADDGKDTIGGEFEAGVLSLVGMNAEAAQAYRKGIATYPDRIESYLLLANLLKDMGQTGRAVGMFQYLAENAERDDLFTIAIDGLLNMGADRKVMQWARRITLQRLAGREDKNYLYQLLSDLSSEVNDKSGQIRAMENSLAVSGTRRQSVLRECMELSSRVRGGVYYSSSSRGPTNKGNEPFFAFGRRLIGLGELMPPQVFLDLGKAFLDDGDVGSAERTFAMARNVADPRGYQREVASIFEQADKIPESLTRYDRLLRTSPSDVALIARVAKLNEKEGKDETAFRFYRRGLNLLISQTPLTTQEEAKQTNRYWAANRDAYDMYSQQLVSGVLVTLPTDQIDAVMEQEFKQLQESVEQLAVAKQNGRTAAKLSGSPRIQKQSETLRNFCFAFDRISDLENMNQLLIATFPQDETLLATFGRQLISRGRYDSVRRMLETGQPNDKQQKQLLVMLGESIPESDAAKLSPIEMWQRLFPAWMADDSESARRILRRVDQAKGRAPGARPSYVFINGRAVLQNQGASSDVGTWMRLANHFGDEGLALQFARSRLSSGGYGVLGIKRLSETYAELLPEERFADLIRYAANLYKEDKNRVAEYLWLTSRHADLFTEAAMTNKEMLQLFEDSTLTIGYQFPFSVAMETIPESIRAEAMVPILDRVTKKYRPRELGRLPFIHDKPIDDAVVKVILESLEGGIEAALQDSYLRYCQYSFPRAGKAVQCPDNADFALQVLELLMDDKVKKREPDVAKQASYLKAVVLFQSGQTDKATEMILDSYDPTERPSNSYVRYTRDWAYREIVNQSPEPFIEVIRSKFKDGKPTVAQTNQLLQLVLQTKDETKIRKAYRDALDGHRGDLQITRAYTRWERSVGGLAYLISFDEELLAQAQKAQKQKTQKQAEEKDDSEKDGDAKTKKPAADPAPIKERLAGLWFSMNHRPNGLEYWIEQDERDLKKFQTDKEARAKKIADAKAKASKDAGKATKKDPKDAAPKKKKKTYPNTIVGIKSAVDDKAFDDAQQSLRKLWRKLPPAVASRYGYRARTTPLNGLFWPEDKPTAEAKQKNKPTEAEKQAAEATARGKARNGLAVFDPPKRKPAAKRTNAWQALAKQPFAADEMRRILRSNTSANIQNVRQVSLGLLRTQRIKHGDEKVFSDLVTKIQSGHISDEILMQLFAMLEEDSTLLLQKDAAVVDVLVDRLDLTNGKRASELASLCAKFGQHDRAKGLYRLCAVLPTSGGLNLAGLVEQAKENYEGDELLELAESMYVMTSQGPTERTCMLSLRSEILPAKQAADRSKKMIDGPLVVETVSDMNYLVQAATVFSRAAEYSLANRCLATVVKKHGQQQQNANVNSYYSSSSTKTHRLSRQQLIQIFPDPTSDDVSAKFDSGSYAQWLAEAAGAVTNAAADPDSKPEILLESFLTIAYRQCQLGEVDAASETLDRIDETWIDQSRRFESLVIDVYRLAKRFDLSLALQQRLHAERRLSHLRYGDLLRDTATVDGGEAAAKLLDELVKWSMDKDLIAAAAEIDFDDEAFAERVEVLQAEYDSADRKYKARQEAAKQRAATRQEWKKADAAKRN